MTIERLKKVLRSEGCSCVIYNHGVVRSFHQRGVDDLYELLMGEPEVLCGAMIADKVIGKAAAAILAVGGVSEIYTDVISHAAQELLQKGGIKFSFEQEVPHIINRAKSGWCPMESATKEAQSPRETVEIIARVRDELRGRTMENKNKQT